MKAKLLIINWLIPFMLMATDSLLQGIIAVAWFGIASYLLNRNAKEVTRTIIRFENKVLTTLKIK
jgi:hypothetical protein